MFMGGLELNTVKFSAVVLSPAHIVAVAGPVTQVTAFPLGVIVALATEVAWQVPKPDSTCRPTTKADVGHVPLVAGRVHVRVKFLALLSTVIQAAAMMASKTGSQQQQQ